MDSLDELTEEELKNAQNELKKEIETCRRVKGELDNLDVLFKSVISSIDSCNLTSSDDTLLKDIPDINTKIKNEIMDKNIDGSIKEIKVKIDEYISTLQGLYDKCSKALLNK